jgi:hypothetical protein
MVSPHTIYIICIIIDCSEKLSRLSEKLISVKVRVAASETVLCRERAGEHPHSLLPFNASTVEATLANLRN